MEKYRPATKEQEDAAHAEMYDAQGFASRRRETMIKEAKAKGELESLEGMHLDYQEDDTENETRLVGQLTGRDSVTHDVVIIERRVKTDIPQRDFAQEAKKSPERALVAREGGVYERSYEGTIDGKPITPKNAELLWERHQLNAHRIRQTKDFVQREVAEDRAQEAQKEKEEEAEEAEEELIKSLLG